MSEFLFKGKKVYYELHGEGEPILVLNGIMMSTESWNAFKPSFSKDNLLILVDFFDQGRSDRLDFEYKHDLQVDLLKALLEHIKIDRVNVVGISYGSAVALQFVLKYPRCVRRLCLFKLAYGNRLGVERSRKARKRQRLLLHDNPSRLLHLFLRKAS